MVVIILEQKQFPLQIKSAPEGYLIGTKNMTDEVDTMGFIEL